MNSSFIVNLLKNDNKTGIKNQKFDNYYDNAYGDNQITFINYSCNYCICFIDIIESQIDKFKRGKTLFHIKGSKPRYKNNFLSTLNVVEEVLSIFSEVVSHDILRILGVPQLLLHRIQTIL